MGIDLTLQYKIKQVFQENFRIIHKWAFDYTRVDTGLIFPKVLEFNSKNGTLLQFQSVNVVECKNRFFKKNPLVIFNCGDFILNMYYCRKSSTFHFKNIEYSDSIDKLSASTKKEFVAKYFEAISYIMNEYQKVFDAENKELNEAHTKSVKKLLAFKK